MTRSTFPKAHLATIAAVAIGVGTEIVGNLATNVRQPGTVIWNGPVDAFEFKAFNSGTQAIAHAVTGCEGFTLAGSESTVVAMEKFHVADRFDYISTAGGAFLE